MDEIDGSDEEGSLPLVVAREPFRRRRRAVVNNVGAFAVFLIVARSPLRH
jgi:hypothetical protein